jgi:hypothetical protein
MSRLLVPLFGLMLSVFSFAETAEERIALQDVAASENAAQDPAGYWLVGDYPERKQAITEGERLSGVTGVEVLLQPVEVDGKTRFRLLVRLFTDEYDQARLRDQLSYAGVTDIRDTNITDNEPGLQSLFAVLDYSGEVLGSTSDMEFATVDDTPLEKPIGLSANAIDKNSDPDAVSAPANVPFKTGTTVTEKQNFLVMGSFHESSHAELMRSKLTESFGKVLVMVGKVNGSDVHRVLVGPVDESAEEDFKARARIEGIESAWIMPGVVVGSLSATEPVEVERSIERKDDPNNDSDPFNLAKMRKKPGSTLLSPDK